MRFNWYNHANESLLDFDCIEKKRHCIKMAKFLPHVRVEFRKSNTKGHYHGFAIFPYDITNVERIYISLFLGSDEKRFHGDMSRLYGGATQPQLLTLFRRDDSIRECDENCLCPETWNSERLRTCKHERSYKNFCYEFGTMKRNPRGVVTSMKQL